MALFLADQERTIRDKDEHTSLINELVDAVPEKHRNWLKSELAWSK